MNLRHELIELLLVHLRIFVVAEILVIGVKLEYRNNLILTEAGKRIKLGRCSDFLQFFSELRHVRYACGIELFQSLIEIVSRLTHGTEQGRNIGGRGLLNRRSVQYRTAISFSGHLRFICFLIQSVKFSLGEPYLHFECSFQNSHPFFWGFRGIAL